MFLSARPVALVGSSALLVTAALMGGADVKPPDYGKEILPVMKTYCASCHDNKVPPGGVNPIQYRNSLEVQKASVEFERVIRALKAGTMPPASAKQPTAAERAKLIESLETLLSGDCKLPDPGRVTIRRLNRTEYANTIRDLVGIDFKETEDFPSDDVGYGFDNIGDVLTVSPLLLEKYLQAAEKIAERAILVGNPQPIRYEGEGLLADQGRNFTEDGSVLYTNSEVYVNHAISVGGSYRLKVRACGMQAGPDPCRMQILVNGKPVQEFDVPQRADKPTDFEFPISFEPGRHRIAAAFTNDFYNPTDPKVTNRDRNLIVHAIEITGPTGSIDYARLPESHRRIIPAKPAPGDELNAARKNLTDFATRAFRRPATTEEVERVLQVFKLGQKNKEPFEKSMQLSVQAILTSPNFLFRVENDLGKPRDLTGYELASRLSYFLWSSMPDAELTSLAATNKLQDSKVLEAQVKRMLADTRSSALIRGFGAQWLLLPKFANFAPDRKLFNQFDNSIKSAMRTEALMFFGHVLQENRSVLDFLDCDYTFVNDKLAFYYDIPDVTGPEFRRVKVDQKQRGGVITLGATLCLTSNPTRTSPTKRGKYVLEQILGTPPPPPPPGADQLKETPKGALPVSIRQKLAEHRKNPDCASCHDQLDPLGFGLENYSPVGQWRYSDEGGDVDSSGTLADGTKFSGPGELKKILLSRKDLFLRSFAEKLLTYALGRGLTLSDNCGVDDIVKVSNLSESKMHSMLTSVVLTDAFRKQGVTKK
ncbi:MAG: DUF1592 domain-containing protein [Fimbriimonadaceae bacterium]